MPANSRFPRTTPLASLPFFWQLQLIGWGGFALLSLPLKLSVYGSMQASLLITAYQLPLSIALSFLLRRFYQLTHPARQSFWPAAGLVLVGTVAISALDVVVSTPINHFLRLFGPADSYGTGVYFFRAAIYLIWSLAYFLVQALLHSREQAFEAAVAAERHRFELLRYQLNPAFLAKSLTTISAEIAENPASARAMTVLLAGFYRNTFRQSDQAHVTTIGDEIGLLRTYLEIERMHLRDALRVRFEVDESLLSQPLPPVLLLPLAEKALKQGGGTPGQPLEIVITVQRAPDGLTLLEIANSGRLHHSRPPMDQPMPDVTDVQAALERYYPGRHRFALSQDSLMTRATLCLPLGS